MAQRRRTNPQPRRTQKRPKSTLFTRRLPNSTAPFSFSTHLFSSSSPPLRGSCHRCWIPSLYSLHCSLGIIWTVRYRTDVEGHLAKLLEREKEDGKLLAKCVEELKKKGVELDLLNEVNALRRAKSLRVEAKAVRKWSGRDFVTLFFFAVACLVIAPTRVSSITKGRRAEHTVLLV
ncbi:hypothetical protein U1Q18_000107 [Sarracenia purpurea var. burkii]